MSQDTNRYVLAWFLGAGYFAAIGEYIKVDEAVYFRNSPHAPMRLTVVGD